MSSSANTSFPTSSSTDPSYSALSFDTDPLQATISGPVSICHIIEAANPSLAPILEQRTFPLVSLSISRFRYSIILKKCKLTKAVFAKFLSFKARTEQLLLRGIKQNKLILIKSSFTKEEKSFILFLASLL